MTAAKERAAVRNSHEGCEIRICIHHKFVGLCILKESSAVTYMKKLSTKKSPSPLTHRESESVYEVGPRLSIQKREMFIESLRWQLG